MAYASATGTKVNDCEDEVGVGVGAGALVGVLVGNTPVGVAVGGGRAAVGVAVATAPLRLKTSCGALAPDSRAAKLMAVEPGVIIPKLYVPAAVT